MRWLAECSAVALDHRAEGKNHTQAVLALARRRVNVIPDLGQVSGPATCVRR
jgi:hypothetical protein